METTTPSTPIRKKNTFLLVICILTFVGSGLGILGGLFSLATADTVATMNSNNLEQMDNNPQTPSFLKSIFGSAAKYSDPGTIKESALSGLLSNLLTLFGAILMLKLKKAGFYLYVAGILFSILIPLFFVGGIIGTISAVMDGIFGTAFIVMYAVNLKHMNSDPPASLPE